MKNDKFTDVTLLVTHYNRSSSLRNLLESFINQGLYFGDIVVSDDGSVPEHLNKIRALQKEISFRLVPTEKNKGLGNNINKGQDQVTTPFTLYIQEDFEPSLEFKEHFQSAVEIMRQEAKWDIVRFYTFPWAKYPYVKEYKKGFMEMVYQPSIWYANHLKFYFYSDHPHLRRTSFFEKFGRYTEGEAGDKTEYNMCLRLLKKQGKGLIYSDTAALFNHENSFSEPSMMKRNSLRLSASKFVNAARFFYLKYKVVKSTIQLSRMRNDD